MTVRDTMLRRIAERSMLPHWLLSVVLGIMLAALAVLIRYLAPVPDSAVIMTGVFPAIMLSVILGGTIAGISAFLAGGILSWYFVFIPRHSFEMNPEQSYTLLGFVLVGSTILMGAEVYRRAERKVHLTKVEFAQREAEHQLLLTREMNHRVKNMLGLIQAVAFQTFGKNAMTAVHEFNGRLKAVSDAQAVLTNGVGPVADLKTLIQNTMKPFQNGNITVVGPSCLVDDQQATWLSLTLHELATNATKYGALSLPYGRVQVDTELMDDGTMCLKWQESNGPRVVPPDPARAGFGTKILSQGNAKVEFLPLGVRCEIGKIRCKVEASIE